jgi:Ca2+-binding RTX toxin-like protein
MRTVLAAVALTLALAATAQASEVTRQGELIRHTPSLFTEDIFVLTDANGTATFQIAPNLGAGTGCMAAGTNTVTCPENGALNVILNLGDSNDTVTVGGFFGDGPFSLPIEVHGDTGNDILSMGHERDVIFGGDGDDRLLASEGQDNIFAGEGADLISGGPGPDFVDGGPGNDDITSTTDADSIQGGAGFDRVFFGAGNDTVTLDAQPNDGVPGQGLNLQSDVESIDGGGGNDRLTGDGNANTFAGGAGADDIRGGANFDTVNYIENAEQRVTLDDIANDGAPGEGDNIHRDVESVSAGPGNDVLIGSATADTLDGGDGNDELRGGGGVDTFFGGPGNDVILARDGLPERVDCGTGGGTATVDTIDTVVACTSTDASDSLVPDLDHDGADRPPRGADCNDHNPAIGPGEREILNNTVDENCDGRADFDRDGDGALAPPAGSDCNDVSARVRPGAKEVVGNRVDENCDGVKAPFPLLGSSIGAFFIIDSRGTRFVDLLVRRAQRGSTVRVACSGAGCPPRDRTVKVKRSRRTLKLLPLVKGLELQPGAKLKIRITKPRTIGTDVNFTMRRAKPPARKDNCVFPGDKRARRCPG